MQEAGLGVRTRGAVPVLIVLLTGLWLTAHFYAFLPALSALLLALAPMVIWLQVLGIMQRLLPWQRSLLSAVTALLPVALAVVLAGSADPAGG